MGVPEVGDRKTFQAEYSIGFGAVRTVEQLRKYVSSLLCYEHEYEITESNIMPGVVGYIGNVTVFADAEDPDKCFVAYRSSWQEGEVPEAFKAAIKAHLESFAEANTEGPAETLCSGSESLSVPPAVTVKFGGSFYGTKRLSIPFKKVVAKAHWKEAEYPSLGAVRTVGHLRKLLNNEQYYEHEYEITESDAMPGVVAYIGNLTVFAD